MDAALEKKARVVMEEAIAIAIAIANERGLLTPEEMQLIADYLAQHPDAAVRSFLRAALAKARRDLN